jgi:CRP-like cAMP-binding protein
LEPAVLDQIPLFAKLTADERAQVAECLREAEVEAGTPLARQGDWAYQLFVIESGEAEVSKNGEVVMTLRAGDVFGEIGLLATGTRTATVVATSPMRLAAMFLRDFKQLERRMPQLADALRETMAERVAQSSL